MRSCPTCHLQTVERIHRNGWEKWAYRRMYKCRRCGRREFVPYAVAFWFGGGAKCPHCGNAHVSLEQRDRNFRLSKNPLLLVQRIIGAKLYQCGECRMQFYDRRNLVQHSTTDTASSVC